MARTTPEGKVKTKIKAVLKQHGAWYTMPMGTGYGCSGVPDFVICHRGAFIAVEAKATVESKVTELQYKSLSEIVNAGGKSMIIHADNLYTLEQVLCEIEREA